jgi:amino acid transporter
MQETPSATGMQREIGLLSLTFIGVSAVIGSGWLFAPLLAAQDAGPASLLAWLIGGLSVGLLALTFAELSAMLPVTGGIARLPHFSHGSLVSMAMGWTAWIGYNTAVPIEVEAMLRYLEPWLPWLYIPTPNLPNQAAQLPLGALSAAGKGVALGLLGFFTLANLFGVRLFARLNASITWFKLAVPLVIVGALMTDRFLIGNFSVEGGFFAAGPQGVLTAVASGGVIFAFLGFRHTIDLAGEARNPQFTVPTAIVLTVLICLVIYALLQIAFIGALTPEDLANGWSGLHLPGKLGPLSALASAAGLLWLVSLINVGAVVSPFGGGLVAVGSMGRLAQALAENGFFPQHLLRLNRFGVPALAMLLNLGFVCAIFLLLPFKEIIALNSAAIILSLSVGPVTLAALRRLDPNRPRPFRLMAARITAPLAFMVASLILYWSGWETFWRLVLCLFVGLIILLIRARGFGDRPLHLAAGAWLLPYLGGLGALSYLGNFGGGRQLIPFGWDSLAVSLLALGIFVFAVRSHLEVQRYREVLATSG